MQTSPGLAQGQVDNQCDEGHGHAGRQIRVQRHPGGLEGLRAVADESRDVIGDGGHGQALHRLLQPQLQPGTAIHRREQVLILALPCDLDPGAQQAAGLRDALGQVVLALADRLTGGHSRAETSGHELVDGLQPRDATLAQLGDTCTHQIGVGAAGTEAELAGRQAALGLGRQPGQVVQQGFVALCIVVG